ncbi:MAG: phosphomannomutase [Deltaproteobacteria bacterium]|nr:phosphomannomutase [Deltaproteobacteria bacterium]
MTLPCFKAYDIRGKVPEELSADLARNIGRAFAERFKPRRVVVGRDMRLSSGEIAGALIEGFREAGVDVVDIGLCGTEMVYFAAFHLEKEGVDGGVMVTASHNPAGYNGMKLVTLGARPISGDSGLRDIEALAEQGYGRATVTGKLEERPIMEPYIEHLLGYVDLKTMKPLTLVSNGGNGCAGIVIDAIEKKLPFSIHKIYNDPDGSFPHGVPNPLLPENRTPTVDAVNHHRADFGMAWDGDFDRCFFFDAAGAFIEGYYMVGLFAEEILRKNPDAAIIHDPRLTWNTIEKVSQAGGRAVMSKTGHAFIKERMRKENAVYGGEMSAHHYFRDFAYCDSGMIPWLLLAQQMSRTGLSVHELVDDMQQRFPASGEINLTLPNAKLAIEAIQKAFSAGGVVDFTDGISIDHDRWRLNVRASNTEPVVRVNVESRGDSSLMEQKTEEVLALLRGLA